MNKCTAAMSSLTYCIKAQRLLESASVSCTVVKLDSSLTKRGCAYGIEFPCEKRGEVKHLLLREGLRPTQFIDGIGGVSI